MHKRKDGDNMSYQDFDYENALSSIKASLFDIYESQERIIGSIEDEQLRQSQINRYIQMKDTAITLIENITNLYDKDRNKTVKKENNNKEIPIEVVEPKVVELQPKQKTENLEESTEEFLEEESDVQDSIQDEVKENAIELESSQPTSITEEMDLEPTLQEDPKEKFYLDDRNGNKPNFAYVPPELFEIIKKNRILVRNKNSEIGEQPSQLHKMDEEQAKGIIVRTDQFMKLALSRHRQESVLRDAKEFRIEQAKKSSKQMIEEERHKMNIKVKSLKAA